MTKSSASSPRDVVRVVRGRPTSDGAGVRLTRVIGTSELDMLDPFLMLDEFRSDSSADYIGGFPEHPHRGFETVTYMLAGRMRHGDNQGNSGLLTPGSVQWMTAGRGILHSEMPEQENGLMWGFQLWVNLPAKDKMTAPRYQDIAPQSVPEVKRDGAAVRVLAGTFDGVEGPVGGIATQPLYLDVRLDKDATLDIAVPDGHNAFVYVYEGQAVAGSGAAGKLVRGDLGVLGKGEGGVRLTAPDAAAKAIVVGGQPLNEPVAKYGPFVMNTPQQIVQAVEDFRAGRF